MFVRLCKGRGRLVARTRPGLALWAAAWLGLSPGCGGARVLDLDGGAPSDVEAPATARLVLDGPSMLTLSPGERGTFGARWIDALGNAVEGGTVAFALEGMSGDAVLSDLGGTTDGDGRVRGGIVAGEAGATFRVRLSAAGLEPLGVEVSVGPEGFGSMTVRVEGGGPRAVETRRVLLHQDAAACAEALGRMIGDRERSLAPGVVETTLRALPAGVRFTAVAQGLNAGGAVVASACVEGVTVPTENTVTVRLDLAPTPLSPEGTFLAEVSLNGGDVLTQRTEELLLGAAGDDAQTLLAALAARLTDRGASAVAVDLLALGDAGETLATALEADDAGPSRAVERALGDLAPYLERLTLSGTLSVAPGSGRWLASYTVDSARLGPPLGERIDVSLDGLPGGTRGAVVLGDALSDDAWALDELSSPLPASALLLGALDGLARQRGVADVGAMLASHAGCEALARWVDTRPEVADACPDTCVRDACDAAVDEALEALRAQATALDGTRSTLRLAGVMECRDDDGDLSVDALRALGLRGTWSEGADGGASVEGTMTGVRATVAP